MRLEELAILSERPIAFHPCLARIGGGVAEGVFLSQLLYWTGKGCNGDGWIYKTLQEWRDETALSRREIYKARDAWKQLGVLSERREGLPCRVYYHVNLQRLGELLKEYAEHGAGSPDDETSVDDVYTKSAQGVPSSLHNMYQTVCTPCTNCHINTEITTETTTETTDISLESASADSREREALPADDLPFSDPPENEDIPVSSVNPLRDQDTSAGRRRRRDADPRSKTPAIQCAKAVNGGRYPPLELYDDIIRILGPLPDGPRLAACRKEWLARGYNPQSWKWLTEWYVRGIPERAVNGGMARCASTEMVYERSMQVIRAHLERSNDGERTDDSGDAGFALCPMAKGTR